MMVRVIFYFFLISSIGVGFIQLIVCFRYLGIGSCNIERDLNTLVNV
jgi:hypothetical protein